MYVHVYSDLSYLHLYSSPDKRMLRNREELLLHLTSHGTCKCGLRCPFRFDEQFNFDPTVIGLPDNSAYIEETQSLCKISHLYRSETTINVTSAKHKPRAPKVCVPKTSPSITQRLLGAACPKKREGVKRLQAVRVSESAKGGHQDLKGIHIKRVENSTGAEAKDVLQVSKSDEALVKAGGSKADGSPSPRNATLATLLKSSRELSWLTNLCTAKLAEPSKPQAKQKSMPISVLSENMSATSLPAVQNVPESVHAVEEKSILSEEISETSSAVVQSSPLQGKEELKVSIMLGKPSSTSGDDSEVIKTLMVSIPRGESEPEGPEEVQQAEGHSEPDSIPTGMNTNHREVEPKQSEDISRHAEMESGCGGLNESRSSEGTLSASESEFHGVGSESSGFREPGVLEGQRGSDRGTWQSLGDEEASVGEVQTSVASQQGNEDVRQDILPPMDASAGSVTSTEGGGVQLPADKQTDAECGDSVSGYSMVDAVGTRTSEPPDPNSNGVCPFVTEGEVGVQRILQDGVKSLQTDPLTTLPHFSPLEELPVSTATPSVFSEFDSFGPAEIQSNYSTMDTTHSPTPGGVRQSDTDLLFTTALASNSVASESQSASLSISSQGGVLSESSHVSSLPALPLVGTKCCSGWSSGAPSGKPKVHSLDMNGTHSVSDQAEQASVLSIPSPYVQEPVTDQLEEVLLVPTPEVPSSVKADIQASANSLCLTGNSVPCSAIPLDTSHHPSPSISPMNGVSLLPPTKPSAASTHTTKSPFAPSTNGVPTNSDPSQLHSSRVQGLAVLAENAGFCNSSPLKIPCANAFLSPKRSPSKDIAMRDFHISIKPLREFNIRKRRSSEMFEADGERFSPDVACSPSPKRQRFFGSKLVGGSFEKTAEGSSESFEGGQSPESEEPSALRGPTAERNEKEVPTEEESESASLVAVLPRDLNIADLVSVLQDSNCGAETSDNILHSQAIGALAAQIVNVAGTQGYAEGASSILVLSHQSPELEAILQAAVTEQMESAKPHVCVDTGSGTPTHHLPSDVCFELDTLVPSVPDKSDSLPAEESMNQEETPLSEATPEQQLATSLSALAEAASTMEGTGEEIKDICDSEARISPGSGHSVVSPLEIHLRDDVSPQPLRDQEAQSLSAPLDVPGQITVPFQVTENSITPCLKSPVSDSVSPETDEMSTSPPTTDQACGDIEQSRSKSSTVQDHVAADLHVEVQGEKEDNSAVDTRPEMERDMEVLASCETSSTDGQSNKVGRLTSTQQTPTAQAEAENVCDRSLSDDEKTSMEVAVAVDVLLQLSRQFISNTSELDDPGDLEVKDRTTGGDSGETVAATPSTLHEAAITQVSMVSESKDLEKCASENQKKEVAGKMEDIDSESLSKESEVQSSDMADANSNVNHTAGRMAIGALECKETMKNGDFDDATAAEAVSELSKEHVSESFHHSPDVGPSGRQEEVAVTSEHNLATSPKVIKQQKSSSPEIQEEEGGRSVRKNRSEPPTGSTRSRNQPSLSSSDQDADPLTSSSGSGLSFSSCSDTPRHSASSGKQSDSPTTSTSTKSPTPAPTLERPPISRGKHKPTPISPPHPKRLIVSVPLDKVSIVHYSVLECYPTPVFGVGDIVWAKASLLPGEALYVYSDQFKCHHCVSTTVDQCTHTHV